MSATVTIMDQMLGAVAIGLTLLALFPYIRDAISRRIRPHRATWLVWAVLATISASAQAAIGGGPAVWFAACQAGGTVLIAALALRCGRGQLTTKTELLVFACAGVGLFLWYITSEPAYALAISISISACAAAPTVIKAYSDPESENPLTWALKLLGSLCAITATLPAGPVMLAYPVYLASLYATVFVALMLGKRRARAFALQMALR